MIKLAWRNLIRARLRTVFAIATIAACTCLAVVLGSIAERMAQDFNEGLVENAADIIVQGAHSPSILTSRIDARTLGELEVVPGVAAVAPLLLKTVRPSKGPIILLLGVSKLAPIAKRLGLSLISGERLSPGSTEQVLIGQRVARKMALEPGNVLALGRHRFTVQGVYSTGLDYMDGGVFLDIAAAEQFLTVKGRVNMAYVSTKRSANRRMVISAIEERFPDVIALPAGEVAGQDMLFGTISSVTRGIGIIGMMIAAVAAINALMMSLLERTQEIGLLQVIGWTRSSIFRLIATEGVILCVCGALIGFAASWPALQLLNELPSIGAAILPRAPVLNLFPHTITFAILMGLFSTVYPWYRAIRMPPAEALRDKQA